MEKFHDVFHEAMEKDRQDMKELILGEVKEKLVKTLNVCLSQKDVDKIKKEFEKNTKLLSIETNSQVNLAEVMSDVKVKNKNKPDAGEESSDEDDVAEAKVTRSFVKPQFMKIKNPPSPIRLAPPTPTPGHLLFEKEYIRNKELNAKKFEKKIQREWKILERQKRKAQKIDANKKYLGFGEVFDPVQAKLKKKAEKKSERDARRMRILKKANVTKEEKDLINELLNVAESSSGSATSPSEMETSASSQSDSSCLLESSRVTSTNSSFSLDSSSSFNTSTNYYHNHNQEALAKNMIENLNAFEFPSISSIVDPSSNTCEEYKYDDLEDLLSM